MRTGFYSSMAATVSRLLADKGQQMILRKRVETSSDPVTGQVIETTEDYVVLGALIGVTDTIAVPDLIKQGDRRVLMEAGVAEPTNADWLIIDGKTWSIINVEHINPAGTPVMYDLLVRQ